MISRVPPPSDEEYAFDENIQESTSLFPINEELQLKRERQLFYWNISLGALHTFQAIVVLAIGLSERSRSSKFKLPLTSVFAYWDKGFPEQKLVTHARIPFVAVTSGFAWMSGVAQFIVCIAFKQYIIDLRRGVNRFRWVEYAFSSSLMICLIALLFGMYDIVSLVLLGSVNACMNWFGYLVSLFT